jgi:dTMP kinase
MHDYTQNKGTLISFEGIEGAGKTTQIELFSDFLSHNGFTVHNFREPGSSPLGEEIRELLLRPKELLNPFTELHLFIAARSELIDKTITPLLKKEDQIVILDRFIDSSIAYQGHGRGIGAEVVQLLHSHGPLSLRPDLTFYLDIDWNESMRRLSSRSKDYFEQSSADFFNRVRNGFLEICDQSPQRVKKIDAALSIESVQDQLRRHWELALKGEA